VGGTNEVRPTSVCILLGARLLSGMVQNINGTPGLLGVLGTAQELRRVPLARHEVIERSS
jgi:hypothetical protein